MFHLRGSGSRQYGTVHTFLRKSRILLINNIKNPSCLGWRNFSIRIESAYVCCTMTSKTHPFTIKYTRRALRCWVFIVLATWGLNVCLCQEEQACSANDKDSFAKCNKPPLECTLYLGESSIPGGGLGVYAGKSFFKGDKVGFGEILIPIVDNLFLQGDAKFSLDDITWSAELAWKFSFEGYNRSDIVFPGMGACANSHLGLHNVDSSGMQNDRGAVEADSLQLGAFSYYHNMSSFATKYIPAGHELFVNYGDNWFLQRKAYLGDVPVEKDYPIANRIVRILNTKLETDQSSQVVHEDVYKLILDTALDNARVKFAMPKTLEELPIAAKTQGGLSYYHLPNVIRDQDWLQTNAYCVDHIKSGISTVAGRGAFATRNLPKDTIVAPLPVLPLNRTYLNVTLPLYGHKNQHIVKGKQLLTNYVFGHPQSNVVLFSYGFNTNYINHSSEKPNVRLQFSTRPYHRHELTLLKSTMLTRKAFGMILELVATRDIAEGEEILLDYGPEWEQAWADHVAKWVRPDSGFVQSFEFNELGQTPDQPHYLLKSIDELPPYPPNIEFACHANPVALPQEEQDNESSYFIDSDGQKYHLLKDTWSAKHAGCIMKCRILEREANFKNLYTVQLLQPHIADEECVFPKRHALDMRPPYYLQIHHVPRSKIYFVDRPHTQDHYMSWAFRHFIGVPDSVWPAQWKDLA